LLLAIALAANAPTVAAAGSLLSLFETAPTCSTSPYHSRNSYIDFTAGKKAAQVFHDPRDVALADAAARNSTREMTALLKHGANPNARGWQGVTMLGWTLRRGSHEAFAILLDAGADATVSEHDPDLTPNADNGRTVVHYAAWIEDPAFLDMLLAHHVSPDLRTSGGQVPLDESILADCDKQFHQLIAAHANLDSPDESGDTPLHLAVQTNSYERALDLLNAGADPTARNRIGKTFQAYLHMIPENVLSQQGRQRIADIESFLTQHHVPIEPRPR
jgi:ankyrin repeat protein